MKMNNPFKSILETLDPLSWMIGKKILFGPIQVQNQNRISLWRIK